MDEALLDALANTLDEMEIKKFCVTVASANVSKCVARCLGLHVAPHWATWSPRHRATH